MTWKAVSGGKVRRSFIQENYLRDLPPSDLVGIYFNEKPTQAQAKVVGQITCPGCKKSYPFEINAWMIAGTGGSAMVNCTNPVCRDETKVTAYPGQEQDKPEDNPLFVFAEPYITKNGQVLSHIALKVTDIIFIS